MNTKEKLQRLFTEHGYEVTENERSLVTTCPQCNKEKHLYLFKETGNGKCMKCGQSFSAAAIVVALTGCTYPDAFKVLNAGESIKSNQPLHFNTEPRRPQDNYTFQPILMPANFLPLSHPDAKPGFDYILRDRGIPWLSVIGRYNLRYCPGMQRVIFPIWRDGICVGWQGRDITGKAELRYTSPKGFPKSRVLMGYDNLNVNDRPCDHVILTEGPIDCLKVAFLDNAVCSMGKEVSTQQIELLKMLPNSKVYLALDPDAFEVFDKIAMALRPEKDVYLMQPPEGRKDFGECTDREVVEAFKNAKPYRKGSQISAAILK